MSFKIKLINYAPHPVLNLSISLYNSYLYKIRHSGKYKFYRDYYERIENLDAKDLEKEIENKKSAFFSFVKKNSDWYKEYDFNDFKNLPILAKDDIIKHLDIIKTVSEKEGLVSLTGGTTGASMKVIYTKADMQERFAILDHFRAQHGYELGKKVAWFSGKNLISEADISKGICSHYDFINKIRFYSTFHINASNFEIYWQSLNNFSPEFIVGFPSSVFEICQIADSHGLRLNKKVKVFFPTAETVLPEHREVINRVLGCKLVNQYASSEGAPFILECEVGNLHIHPLTGLFEVVDKNMEPSKEGETLVTSFTTHGTPLVRYRIGDSIKLAPSESKCSCGSLFPLVERIEGRSTDYILSPTKGKVNLGNISNSTKDVGGIIKFQVHQNNLHHVDVLIVANEIFNLTQQNKFFKALQERFGTEMTINLIIVDDIPTEKSGKFRIVKNSLEK